MALWNKSWGFGLKFVIWVPLYNFLWQGLWFLLDLWNGTILLSEVLEGRVKDWWDLHTKVFPLDHFQQGQKVEVLDVQNIVFFIKMTT